jgi:hypothetical protein
MTSAQFERAVAGFIKAADFQLAQMAEHGWRKFVTNYLREHYRASTGDAFTNTNSPMVLREVLQRRPDLVRWITVK